MGIHFSKRSHDVVAGLQGLPGDSLHPVSLKIFQHGNLFNDGEKLPGSSVNR